MFHVRVSIQKFQSKLIFYSFILLQNETIIGSINSKYIQQFEEYFAKGNILLITDFEFWKTSENYKISSHRFLLCFNDQSTIEIYNDPQTSIDFEKY